MTLLPPTIGNVIAISHEGAPRLSVPAPGRTLSSASAPVAARLRAAAAHLRAGLDPSAREVYDRAFGPRDSGLAVSRSSPDPVPWALVGMWATLRAVSDVDSLSIESAAAEFCCVTRPELVECVTRGSLGEANAQLRALDGQHVRELLPYVLDQHRPGTRRSVLRDPNELSARSARRRAGIYYTPADVAEYMAEWVARYAASDDLPLLDPACGTGVFLLAIARYLMADVPVVDILGRLYGIDLDPIAIDGTCFVLTAELAGKANAEPWRLWHLARLNLAERDTLTLVGNSHALRPDVTAIARERVAIRSALLSDGSLPAPVELPRPEWAESLAVVFPERPGDWNVVGNPPYAPLGDRTDLAQLPRRFSSLMGATVTPATNAFVPFMELMWAATGKRGRACLVVPMSIAYNTTQAFSAVRRAIVEAGGTWAFRFFDRTPDALFGDDVKQRTAIVTREPGDGTRVLTGSILRWTSRLRSRLFESLPAPIELACVDIALGIPKLGSDWEVTLYEALRSTQGSLGQCLAEVHGDSQPSDRLLFVGSTAYNSLVLYLGVDALSDAVDSDAYSARDPDVAAWAYAVLASSVVYWMWRVDGDGFHVPASWLRAVPFMWRSSPGDYALASLGRTLWDQAQRNAIVSVNGGRRTVSFRPTDAATLILIDQLVLQGAGCEPDLAPRLWELKADTVSVGREGNRR